MTSDEILRQFDFYRDATAARRAEYSAAVTALHLSAGTTFYREGDMCANFGLVGRGDVRIFKAAPGGREITLYHVRDGEPCLVNMLCVFLSRGAMASAVTEAPTDAAIVPGCAVRTWIASDEPFRAFIFATMAARLVDVMTLAAEISISRMDARLAGLLVRLASLNAAPNTVDATHDELASELGTAREVVSRLLKDFERAGAVHLGRGHIALTNLPALLDISTSARRDSVTQVTDAIRRQR